MTIYQLTSVIAGIILETIREKKGRLTEISDQSVINRQEFDEEGLANMKLYRFIRLGKTMAKSLPRNRYDQMKSEISEKFWECIENEEFEDEDNNN